MDSRPLYPEIEPYETGYLQRTPPHSLYWEECGSPSGIPVLFVHGGPGAGATPGNRRFFDPAAFRIIVFDQRGAGRSRPLGCLEDNNTAALIADMESLRRARGVARWILFGGSWGSTLALAYAQAHPDRCLALVLRGIFLCRRQEIDWFLNGMRAFFPEHWHCFAEAIPENERQDLLAAYYRRLTDPDPAIHLPAALAWSRYEGACSTLLPDANIAMAFGDHALALGLARIEAHYFVNDIFLPPNSLLERVPRIRHIPGFIVQGRYDMVCPVHTADDLHTAWPEADYQVIPDAGHSSLESGTRAALVRTTDRLRDRPWRT